MITDISHKKTKVAILLASVLKEPFACIYPLLPFILLKDLSALPLHIFILTMLRPIASLGSFYISELISRKVWTLRYAVLFSGILARVSFIPALLTDNVTLYIIGSAMFMIFSRAEMPAWMEVIKRNIHRNKWESTFSLGSTISYTSGVFFSLLLMRYIDSSFMAWKIPFALSLLLGCVAVCSQGFLFDNDQKVEEDRSGLAKRVLDPIKDTFILMKENAEFRKFQWAFMVGGFGLMLIQPVIPIYLTNVLSIKYADLMIAFSICKALGFVLTTPLWTRMLKTLSYRVFVFFTLTGFSLFMCALSFAQVSVNFIFLAYLIYGIAQAGSHLIWHLSGPLFSGEESSSRYSGVNLVMVGIRGLIGPALGGSLLLFIHPVSVFAVSMVLSFTAGLYYLKGAKEKSAYFVQ